MIDEEEIMITSEGKAGGFVGDILSGRVGWSSLCGGSCGATAAMSK